MLVWINCQIRYQLIVKYAFDIKIGTLKVKKNQSSKNRKQHKEFVPKGRTINGSTFYPKVMTWQLYRFSWVRPEFSEKDSRNILHDMAHSTLIVKSFLMKKAPLKLIIQPIRWTPSPADFFQFSVMKTVLKIKYFRTLKGLIKM